MDVAAALLMCDRLQADLVRTTVRERLFAAPRLERARLRLQQRQPAERILAECRLRIEAGIALVEKRTATPLTMTFPEALPVSGARDEIQARIRERGCLILVGETGSGKTTQLPKMLLDMGIGRRGCIALTQPRRLAALAMAARISEEVAAPPEAVVHSVRFDDRVTDNTIVRVMTDGLLLAECSRDGELSRYEAIIIDEAHERSLNIDMLMALLKILRQRRPDLIIAVSSASIAAEAFAAHFGDDTGPAPIVQVGGRTFPVDICWRPPRDDDLSYLAASVAAIIEIHEHETAGDILVFLPTERDILEASRRLRELKNATVLPCFGRLSASEQKRIFSTVRGRKIVLATNIAETSLTIPGIVYVIDAGLARVKRFNQGTRTERLPVEAVAQASCIQRAGRAGRVQAGICIRLYAEDDFQRRPMFADPEILRANLAGVVLNALYFGIELPESLPWLDAPAPQAWTQAWSVLAELDAIEDDTQRGSQQRRLTARGRRMAALPVDPSVARILLAGLDHGVAHEACTIAAYLSVQDPRVRPLGQESKADAAHLQFRHEAGDIGTLLNLWDRIEALPSQGARARFAEQNYLGVRRLREWADVRHQLWGMLRENGKGLPAQGFATGAWPLDAVHRSVLTGMIGNVLLRDPQIRAYRAAGGREAHVHPGSALRSGKGDDTKKSPPPPTWLLACELVETTRLFARMCAPIDPEWILATVGDRCKRTHRDPHYEPRQQRVVCTETITWKGLPVRDGQTIAYEHVDAPAAVRIFAEALAGEAGSDIARFIPSLRNDQELLRQARTLRSRLRRIDVDIDEQSLADWYAQQLLTAPVPVASVSALRRFIKERGEAGLALDVNQIIDPIHVADAANYAPQSLQVHGQRLDLAYRFTPGHDEDGATVTVPEALIGEQVRAILERGVVAWWPEMVECWIKALPKDQRRQLQPTVVHATDIVHAIRILPGQTSVADLVHAAFQQRLGPCEKPDFLQLPAHLTLRIRVVADDGGVLYCGRDHHSALGLGRLGDPLARLRARYGTQPQVGWPTTDQALPYQVEDGAISGFVGLMRDRLADGQIAARCQVIGHQAAAKVWHDDAVLALIEQALDAPLTTLAQAAASPARTASIEKNLGLRLGGVRRALALEAATETLGRVRTAAEFQTAVIAAQKRLPQQAFLDEFLAEVAGLVDGLRQQLKRGTRSLPAAAAMRGVAADIERLMQPGWPTRLPWACTRRMPDFLAALQRRLSGAGSDAATAQRLAKRAADLHEEWQHAIGDDPRLIGVLGLRPLTRQLAADLEDCLLAMATPGASSALGFAERRFQDGCRDVAKIVETAQQRLHQARHRLIDVHTMARSIPDQHRRQALLDEVDTILRNHPDLTLGADIDAQISHVQALAERVRVVAEQVGSTPNSADATQSPTLARPPSRRR